MASTNHTTNYNLSQFIGADKPAWLSDYNGDMGKIDTGIHNAQTTATAADGKADNNTTAIGTLTNLNTTDKSSCVAAINEANTLAGTANTAAGSALSTANAAGNKADTALSELQRFNLTNRTTLTPSANKGSITTSVTNVQFATDSSSSVFKVYGRFQLTNLTSAPAGDIEIHLGTTSLRPTQQYTINAGCICCRQYANGTVDVVPRNLIVYTNGLIAIEPLTATAGQYNTLIYSIPPCLYFNTDFGDN